MDEDEGITLIPFSLSELDLLVLAAIRETKRHSLRRAEYALAVFGPRPRLEDYVQARQESWLAIADKLIHWRKSVERAEVWNVEEDTDGN